MNTSIRLFVYGTLMRDGCRSHILKDQNFIEEVKTTPEYQLLDLHSYPGLVAGSKEIVGELWEVQQSLVPTLDHIEGVPWLYQLKQVSIQGHLSEVVFSYLYQRGTPKSIVYEGCRWNNSR